MSCRRFDRFASLFVAAVAVALPGSAQWATQSLSLRPGWNAVFLEVTPHPEACETVFEGVPVESVWEWNATFSPVQYVQDPATLVPEQPGWFVFFPSSSSKAFLSDLHALQGGHAYLVQLGGTQAADVTISGQPSIRTPNWASKSFNLAGFHVSSSSPPTFAAFLAPDSSLQGQPVYRLAASGQWERVTDPATVQMSRGEAYWVYCQGSSAYAGPLAVRLDQSKGLEYGRVITELTLHLKNVSASDKVVTLQLQTSGQPPDSGLPELAGDVPLSYYRADEEVIGWTPLAEPVTLSLAAGAERGLRLAVRRADMASFAPSGEAGALYQSLLEVTDDSGVLYTVPVTARGISDGVESAKAEPAGERAGLWVGYAVVREVSEAANPSDAVTPTPTASEFQFRLMVHVDGDGEARLLQKVVQMQRPGTYAPDPADSTVSVVDEPMRYVLLTRDDLVDQFSGTAMRDGQLAARRISSAAFALNAPVPMAGAFSSSLSCEIALSYDDPLNPFVHTFHPGHDNLDATYDNVLSEGKESYSISRQIELDFTEEDPEGLTIAGWGDNQAGGAYRETITGVHKKPVYVRGTFRLNRVSRVAVLNDGIE